MSIADLRREYFDRPLRRANLNPDPFAQFEQWFTEACRLIEHEPNAMCVSTVGSNGRPSSRMVLLKSFDENGFVFFTNLESRKAREMAQNPNVSLLLCWLPLSRQLIIEGTAERVSAAEAMVYFATRPRGSQLGAWISRQSSVITSRSLLEAKWEEMKRSFAADEVPLPTFWGGFRVRPTEFEFWQGRAERLHDRFRYRRDEAGAWAIERLQP
jgi:pyridoxamine 5'-phosphate oxidase